MRSATTALATALLVGVACVAVWAGRSPAAFPGHNGRIVFQRKLPGGLEIFTMRSDGSDQHQLTHDPRNFDPSYSASGKRIAFDSYRDGDDEIFVMSPDGSHLHQVTHNSVGDALADISPNGRKILFTRFGSHGSRIYVMRASGTHQRKLGHGSGAVFSPDARKVAFYRLGDILVMRANGTDVPR